MTPNAQSATGRTVGNFTISREPMPTTMPGARTGLKEALQSMQAGECLTMPVTEKAKYSTVYAAARAAGVRVTIRKTDEGILKVWRTE